MAAQDQRLIKKFRAFQRLEQDIRPVGMTAIAQRSMRWIDRDLYLQLLR